MKKRKNVLLALTWHDHRLVKGVAAYAAEYGWHLSSSSLTHEQVIPWGWKGDGVLAWLAAGFLWLVWIEQRAPLRHSFESRWNGFGRVEAAVVFGLLDLLFLAFVLIQFRYLFGGAGTVEASSTLT